MEHHSNEKTEPSFNFIYLNPFIFPVSSAYSASGNLYIYTGISGFNSMIMEKDYNTEYEDLNGPLGILGFEHMKWENVSWFTEAQAFGNYRNLTLGIRIMDPDSLIFGSGQIFKKKGINMAGPFTIINISAGVFMDQGEYKTNKQSAEKNEKITSGGIHASLSLFELRGNLFYATLFDAAYKIGFSSSGNTGITSLGIKFGVKF